MKSNKITHNAKHNVQILCQIMMQVEHKASSLVAGRSCILHEGTES
jgi:hypothetical protein